MQAVPRWEGGQDRQGQENPRQHSLQALRLTMAQMASKMAKTPTLFTTVFHITQSNEVRLSWIFLCCLTRHNWRNLRIYFASFQYTSEKTLGRIHVGNIGYFNWHVPSEKGTCTWPCACGTRGLSMCTSRKDPGTQGKKRIGISRSGSRVMPIWKLRFWDRISVWSGVCDCRKHAKY